MLVAKIYSVSDVGIASVVISSVTIIIQLSRFGLDQSLIKYVHKYGNIIVFSTSVVITTIFALLFGIIFLLTITLWSSDLKILNQYPFLFIFFILVFSLFSICASMYLAIRETKNYLIQSLLVSSRVILIFPLIPLGAIGILLAWILSLIGGLIFSFYIFFKLGIKFNIIDLNFLKDSLVFSGANYLSQLFLSLPALILPLIILNILGPEASAFFFITYSIASILFMIPTAICTSLFVEVSHGESLRENKKKAIVSIFTLLSLGFIVFNIFSYFLLDFFGKGYASNFLLFRLLVISSFFVAIVYIYIAIQKIQNNNLKIIQLNVCLFFLIIILSIIFLNLYGLIGVGFAWLISYMSCSIFLIKGINK